MGWLPSRFGSLRCKIWNMGWFPSRFGSLSVQNLVIWVGFRRLCGFFYSLWSSESCRNTFSWQVKPNRPLHLLIWMETIKKISKKIGGMLRANANPSSTCCVFSMGGLLSSVFQQYRFDLDQMPPANANLSSEHFGFPMRTTHLTIFRIHFLISVVFWGTESVCRSGREWFAGE